MTDKNRAAFEAVVIKRFKESGYLEVQIRVECLGRSGDGYQDGSVDAYWDFWNAAKADTGAALAHARHEAINAKGIAAMCVVALTQAEGFVASTNRKAWGTDEGMGFTLPIIRDTLQRARIFGKGNPP